MIRNQLYKNSTQQFHTYNISIEFGTMTEFRLAVRNFRKEQIEHDMTLEQK